MIRRTDQGFVSLFTAIMLSLLLIIITMSIVALEVVQLRKAEDSEQSTRAYYAAEAGIEEAVRLILDGTIAKGTGDEICHDTNSFDAAGLTNWSCMKVSFSGTPEGILDEPDDAKTIDTGDVNTISPKYQSIIVEWNQYPNPGLGFYNDNSGYAGNFSSAASYNRAPPLEISMLEYPSGGFSANQVCVSPGVPAGCVTKLRNMLIVPHGNVGSPIVNFSAALGHGPWEGNCAPLPRTFTVGSQTKSGYNCYAILQGFDPNQNHLFRVRSRYDSSSYRMTFMDQTGAAGGVVQVPDGTATIDVTAQSGDASRRVVTKMPIVKGAHGGLNYVIYSDTDVCKNFEVVNNAGPANPDC